MHIASSPFLRHGEMTRNLPAGRFSPNPSEVTTEAQPVELPHDGTDLAEALHGFERKERLMFDRMKLLLVVAMILLLCVSCGGPGTSGEASSKPKITYKCLSSSCDATVTVADGDPVPEHCGKRMIK